MENKFDQSVRTGGGIEHGAIVRRSARADSRAGQGSIVFANIAAKIVINEIIIEGPEFILETGVGLAKSNIGTILANIEEFTNPSDAEPVEEESGSSKNVQIDLLRITGGNVKVSNKLLGGHALTVPLPDIELTDIGANDDGTTFGESIKIVFQAINQGIVPL